METGARSRARLGWWQSAGLDNRPSLRFTRAGAHIFAILELIAKGIAGDPARYGG